MLPMCTTQQTSLGIEHIKHISMQKESYDNGTIQAKQRHKTAVRLLPCFEAVSLSCQGLSVCCHMSGLHG